MDLMNSLELSPVIGDVDLDVLDFPLLVNRGEPYNNQDLIERKLNQVSYKSDKLSSLRSC